MTAFCLYRRQVVHTTDLSLRLWHFVQCCAIYATDADTARRRHLRISRRPAVTLQSRSCNPRGSYLGCLGATGREKWSLASLGVKVRLCHAPCAQVRCPVGIWNCHPIFPWCMATASPPAVLHDNSRRSLSLQVAKKTIPYTQVLTPQQIPLCLCWTSGVLVADVLVQVSQGSAATDLRWGESFNKFLFRNSLLNIVEESFLPCFDAVGWASGRASGL